MTMLGISVDSPYAHKAFQEKLGIDTTLLSDFEPKGEVARAFGSYIDGAGIANRTLVLIDEDGTVAWTYESPSPGGVPRPRSSCARPFRPSLYSLLSEREREFCKEAAIRAAGGKNTK